MCLSQIPLCKALLCAAAVSLAAPAAADIQWMWNYSGAGVAAGGTFTTNDTPDESGFYQILSLHGQRNGEAIVDVYPTGSAIPGNEPYTLDNVIRVGPQNQITVHGFGFRTLGGHYANPYYADFKQPPSYVEVYTVPPFNGVSSELAINFSASPMPCMPVFNCNFNAEKMESELPDRSEECD